MGPFLRVLVAWLSAVCGTTVQANPTDAALVEEIVIYGRATPQIGHVTAASEGVVGYDDIALPPLLRVGELVEAVPGMVATQHSGTGKANQYFLRGFNLDHGTDFSAAIEGAPINMRSHGHGQGYLDLNFLIPELIETTTYRKGPYTASTGDFSSAGGVAFNLYDELAAGVLSVGAGENDYYRLLAADTLTLGGETERYSLQGDLDFGAWRIAVHALTYDFALYSNFTYFLDDQQDGDEFEHATHVPCMGRRSPVPSIWHLAPSQRPFDGASRPASTTSTRSASIAPPHANG